MFLTSQTTVVLVHYEYHSEWRISPVSPRPEVIKPFFMLNSDEREMFSANKYKNAITVGIFIFINREIFMPSYI